VKLKDRGERGRERDRYPFLSLSLLKNQKHNQGIKIYIFLFVK
jgi:hypothetical protein